MSKIITTSSQYQEMTPNDLLEGIAKENAKARSIARKSLEHVRNCGEMLLALKSKVGHGQWKGAIIHLGMSQKTISNYMRIASNWQRVAVLDRGVKDALKLLAREDTPPAPKPPAAPSRPAASEVVEAEVIEPETLVVDGTKSRICDDPVDPKEPLFIAIREGMPDATPEPIFHAIERLIYALISTNSKADYINSLADAVFLIEGKKPKP